MYSLLILSFLVTPRANRSILISSKSTSASWFLVLPTVSKPYIMLGGATVWWIFPFILDGTLLSHSSPDISLYEFSPACTRFFISLVHPPSACTEEPRYLNSSTLGTSAPPTVTAGNFSSYSFTPKYSVVVLLTFISLLSKKFLHLYKSSSISFLLFLTSTMSSANIIDQVASFRTSPVSWSKTTENNNGLSADPWCRPTLTLKDSVTPATHLTIVSHPTCIFWATFLYFSVTLAYLIQSHSSCLGTLS